MVFPGQTPFNGIVEKNNHANLCNLEGYSFGVLVGVLNERTS